MKIKTNKERAADLRGKLLGIEMDLHLVEREIEELKDNIAFLEQAESDLKYNVQLHKKPGIISVAKEYQKTVWQLGVVEKQLKKHKLEVNKLSEKIEKLEEEYNKAMLEYEHIFKCIQEEKAVLPFVLREKR